MLKDEPSIVSDRGTRRTTPVARYFVATCALLVTTLVCSIVVVAVPRPVQPSQLPALRLPRAAVEAALRDDEALAKKAPQSAELTRWLELYSEEGLAEREPSVDLAMIAEQRAELKAIVDSEFPKLGHDGVRAWMARITDRALAALDARKVPTDAYGLLGVFPGLLVRYGYVEEGGHRLAPELAVRALYKVRFNMLCQRAHDSDLSELERQAYEGWTALHASGVPAQRRAEAARVFAQTGGRDGREALAIWLYQGGMHEQASGILTEEYRRTGALRLRNMLLFARRQGG